ncbi:hypothetical protein BX600DRAFT_444556 [Xylariales sp. PMI_506]|nr:hypothetical protein BX600DRAFT_444556 [Xylariales sp. PMI_506]
MDTVIDSDNPSSNSEDCLRKPFIQYAEHMQIGPEVVVYSDSEAAPEVIPPNRDDNAPEVVGGDAPEPVEKGDDTAEAGVDKPGKRPFWKSRKAWILVAIVVCIIIIGVVVGAVVGSRKSNSDTTGNTAGGAPNSAGSSSVLGTATSSPSSTSTGMISSTTATSTIYASYIPWENGDCTGSNSTSVAVNDTSCNDLDGESLTILDLEDNCVFRTYATSDCDNNGSWSQHVTIGACFNITTITSFEIICS